MAAAVAVLALLTFFQFPGRTWLQQDTQIYVPLLEHLRDPSVLRNDILVERPHVTYTVYDEAARGLRAATGLQFREVLGFQQLVTRALGIWGLYLLASAFGLSLVPALAVAAICSLGATIVGPSVLTFEYEPTPRAFAVPLLICAAGLASHARYAGAAAAAGAAILYHPPTAVPFLILFVPLAIARRRVSNLWPLAVAVAVLAVAAWQQAGPAEVHSLWATLTPLQEQLQRMRTAYVWISAWRPAWIFHYVLLSGVLIAAFARVRRIAGTEPAVFALGLPLIGMASMPLSWLLLERAKLAILPQLQPMRALLFVALFMTLMSAVAGARAAEKGRIGEAFVWFVAAYALPLHPVVTDPLPWTRVALLALLAGSTALLLARNVKLAPAAPLAAFFAIPLLGGVVNYPALHTPELQNLSQWARSATASDAIFAFPDAARKVYPGIFRSEALRAVYVDWKGGGQINYLADFGGEWWRRWQAQTIPAKDEDLARYAASGVQYVVLLPQNRLPRKPVFENSGYLVYSTAAD